MDRWTCRRCRNGDHKACEGDVRGLTCACACESGSTEYTLKEGRAVVDVRMHELYEDIMDEYGFVPAFIGPDGEPARRTR